jgi:hypothetical protein
MGSVMCDAAEYISNPYIAASYCLARIALIMASVAKAQEVNARMATRKGKRKYDNNPDSAHADDDTSPPPEKKRKNKQRVLLLSSRGVTHRMRHLMNDLEALLPQGKKGKLHFIPIIIRNL